MNLIPSQKTGHTSNPVLQALKHFFPPIFAELNHCVWSGPWPHAGLLGGWASFPGGKQISRKWPRVHSEKIFGIIRFIFCCPYGWVRSPFPQTIGTWHMAHDALGHKQSSALVHVSMVTAATGWRPSWLPLIPVCNYNGGQGEFRW